MTPERRIKLRLRAYRPVRLQPRGSATVIETLTKDISAGGMRCLSPKPVPVSTPVTIELHFGAGQEPLLVEGRTVWFQTLPESDQYDLGISFVDLTEQKQRRLSAYFESLTAVPV